MTIHVPAVNGDPAEAAAAVAASEAPLPEALPVLPLRDSVAFPDTMLPLAVGQERSIKLLDDVLAGNRMLVMVASKEPEAEEPGPDDLYSVGVVGVVARMMKVPDGTVRILVQCGQRVELGDFVASAPYLVARITAAPDELVPSPELEGLRRNVQATFSRIIEDLPYLPEELQLAVANLDDPADLAHLIAGSLRIGTEEKQRLLEERDVTKRLRLLSEILARELELVEIGSRIQTQVRSEMERGQREYLLRQQLRAIQEELGEVDEQQAETDELRKQLEEANLPEHAMTVAERELSRFARLPPQSAEHGVIRNYLEWIASLPWSKSTEDNLDLKHARRVLDRDHYDIDRVKDRILEFLAVRKLNPEARSSIVLFVGPPGVGKTSLGRSIASAMERRFERISVGGVRDESEIRGHRRTYIGALPGTIVRALRDAGSNNPVLMIDEIDKMGADFRGDPSSAMLEVLDPEQNSTFRDHYLDLPFDLSNVFFICTANQVDTIPPALLDRMETIELAGYTHEEKREIAVRYLVPRQMERNGLGRSKIGRGQAAGGARGAAITFTKTALDRVIDGSTREAGVRNLEREIGSICRKVAREFAEGSRRSKRTIRPETVEELLGKPRFQPEVKRRTSEPGVATGLAWTPVGGDVLFVEAVAYPGDGKLQITGQLGDVMKESAAAALSYVRNLDGELVSPEWFREHDIHLHVPAGAIPKDGPSAGITMATAIASRASCRPVRSDTAMTGEVTLTGLVLPIGGLKEKALAAQRAGIRRLIIPRRNERDIDDIPEPLRKKMNFTLVDTVDEVLDAALQKRARRSRPPEPG
jgi:ATP-dependent Lon protease